MASKAQFNVYLPPELVREFKHAVVDEGGTLSTATAEAIQLYLDRRRRTSSDSPAEDGTTGSDSALRYRDRDRVR